MTFSEALKASLEEAIEMKTKREDDMNINDEILKELVSIRKLLERQDRVEYSGEPFKWDHKCLACGQYHPNRTPCPHMMTHNGDS